MKITRKEFLQIGGMGVALGATGGLVKKVLAAEPAATNGIRKRWGMVIDFEKCRWDSNCDSYLLACRKAHNIPQIPDSAREVKWIWKERYANAFPFGESMYLRAIDGNHPLPILCNHCATPACTKVCPTKATWKREEDGIVMMDWHRCIGCRYCMAACPYGSRSFNWSNPREHLTEVNPDFPTRTRGVVEKCNFCEERLAKGEPPACVQACTNKALVFGDLEDPNSEVRRLLASRHAIQRQPELGTGPAVFYLV